MPFVLKNAPATFHRYIYVIVATVKRQYAFVYIDDITVFLMTPKEHLQHFEEVIKILNKSGMTIKLNHCSIFTETIHYLCHDIASGKLHGATKTPVAI